MVPGLRRTAYKVVGSRGSLPIHQTRELRLGPADLPPAAQSAPALPRPTLRAWRRRGRTSRTRRLVRWVLQAGSSYPVCGRGAGSLCTALASKP